jgi:hypothetical protein
MRLKPPPRKLLQILCARNQPLTRKHVPAKILRCPRRNLVLEVPRIDRSSTRPHMQRNEEVITNSRNPIMAHRISHHRRNPSTKRALQILKLDDRDLRTTRRLERRSILERSSAIRRHRHLRTSRNNRNKSQSHNQTIHSATHSTGRPAPHEAEKPALAFAVVFLLSSFAAGGGSACAVAFFFTTAVVFSCPPVQSTNAKRQSNFQSTTNLLTAKVK